MVALLPVLARARGAGPEPTPTLVLDAGGHTTAVWQVLFTPDGRELITASPDKTIRTWDVASGEPLRVLRPPIGPGLEGVMLFAAALAPDGRTLAVGSSLPGGGTVVIYLIALPAGRIVRVLKGHAGVILALAFAPDGTRLASSSEDNTARIWDVATGQTIWTLKGHTNLIKGVAWSPTAFRLATASFDKTCRIWDVATGATTAVLQGHEAEVICAAWRPDGRVLATGGSGRSIRLWGPDGAACRGFDDLGDAVIVVTYLAFTAARPDCWPPGQDRAARWSPALLCSTSQPAGSRSASTGTGT